VDVLYDLLVIANQALDRSLGGAITDLMSTRSRLGQLHQQGPARTRSMRPLLSRVKSEQRRDHP